MLKEEGNFNIHCLKQKNVMLNRLSQSDSQKEKEKAKLRPKWLRVLRIFFRFRFLTQIG